jgi:hypothetical protein
MFLMLSRRRGIASQDLGEVECATCWILGDLLTATESIGYQKGLGCGLTDGRQKGAFGQDLRDAILFPLEPERSSHTAAAWIQEGYAGSRAAEKANLGVHFGERFVVAVPVEDYALPGEVRGLAMGCMLLEEIAEEEGLAAEAGGASVVREEVAKFVTEDTGTGGFEEDEGPAGVDLGSQGFENALEVASGFGQEAEVVEGASAAEVMAGDLDPEACGFEDLPGGNQGLRMVVVVPGVGPKEDVPGSG